jgi:hypothetical protein
MDAIIQAAVDSGCDAIHPGYGFLSERAEFARRCAAAGLTFIGPAVGRLELFGDKARAREAALAADVPVSRGLDRSVTLEEARDFLQGLPAGQGAHLRLDTARTGQVAVTDVGDPHSGDRTPQWAHHDISTRLRRPRQHPLAHLGLCPRSPRR